MFPPAKIDMVPLGGSLFKHSQKFIWYSMMYIAKHFVVHFKVDYVAKTLVVPMSMGVIFNKGQALLIVRPQSKG
jgi:hypothetical protein